MNRAVSQILFAAIVAGVFAYGTFGDAPSPANAPSSTAVLVQGYTLPDKEYKISFPTMGVVKTVNVKEGDVVEQFKVLMVQDTSEELAELKVLQFDADSDKPIEAARADHELKKVKAVWAKKLLDAGGQNEREVAETAAEEKIAEIKVQQAIQEKEQYKLKRDKQQTHIDRMTIRAPMAGVVKDLINDVGSTVDPTRPSITIVQNNPLIVDVQVPALASLQMKVGDKLRVSYDKKEWKDASVSVLSPKANPGAGNRSIHLELKNPEGHPSGLQIFVELPDKLLAASENR